MSFCSNCGKQIESENQRFCANCGAKVNETQVPVREQTMPVQPDPVPLNPVVSRSMKWFKFLIYFALFLGALINFAYGFNYITGDIYTVQSNGQVTAEMVYDVFGTDLKILDVIAGILMIAIAAFGIYTRIRLAKYKKNAPMCVYILYSAGAGFTLLYNIALLAITGLNTLTAASNVISIIVSIVLVVLNYVYFTKRKELFIH